MKPTTLKERLEQALEAMPEPRPTQADLARAAKIKPPSVSDWFTGKTKTLKGETLLSVSALLRVNPTWLNTGRGAMRPGGDASSWAYRLTRPEEFGGATGEIELLDARGSCGGGSIMWEMEERQPLVKESGWFKKYGVQAEDLMAVFADGDSMAEFIVDGDIVIFDRSKTELKSGCIYLVDHPDGLKIKRMRRDIDGSWILESMNADKRRYPDEKVAPEQADLIRIRGQFVYRQGG